MPPTSIFIRAASSGTSGIGYSRISVLLGPVGTAASTFSPTARPSYNDRMLRPAIEDGPESGQARFSPSKVLGPPKKRAEHVEALDRMMPWTREPFKLATDA